MEARELIILKHFLKQLEQKHRDSEVLQTPVSESFIHFLSREELIEILILMFDEKAELEKAYPSYEEASNETLLFEYIADEYYILYFFIHKVLKKYTL